MEITIPLRSISFLLISLSLIAASHSQTTGKPNILWFVIEDMSANFSYYGETAIESTDGKSLGKTDYNFEWNKGTYDSPDWSARKPGQPFFMQVQMRGGKLRGVTR